MILPLLTTAPGSRAGHTHTGPADTVYAEPAQAIPSERTPCIMRIGTYHQAGRIEIRRAQYPYSLNI